jgi:ribosome recycling factor
MLDEASVRQKMQVVVGSVSSDISSVRTGRAMPSIVEGVMVSVYGGAQRLKIQELASITSPDPASIVISPWDKSIIGEIRKGILEANIGFNPSIDGEVIRISVPPLTTEDREKFVKLLSQKLESGRVMIRQIRAEVMKEVEKAFLGKEFGEDEKFREEKKVQGITDEYIGKIEDVGEKKKQELLQI